MAFVFKKISNYGTAHPIMARLSYQPSQLIKWAALPEDKRQAVLAVYMRLGERLIKCQQIFEHLQEQFTATLKECEPKPGTKPTRIPHVIGLEGQVEAFLYEGKNFLRDLTQVPAIFYEQPFNRASQFHGRGNDKIVSWAEQRFGSADPFVKTLKEDENWVGEIIERRNAIEHPGGRSGTLTVNNFELTQDGTISLPVWYRDDQKPGFILTDLKTLCHNLLTFAEELLVFGCIEKCLDNNLVTFAEIPEKDRRPECPERFRPVLRDQAMARLITQAQ
jgi:hypothetical protein